MAKNVFILKSQIKECMLLITHRAREREREREIAFKLIIPLQSWAPKTGEGVGNFLVLNAIKCKYIIVLNLSR